MRSRRCIGDTPPYFPYRGRCDEATYAVRCPQATERMRRLSSSRSRFTKERSSSRVCSWTRLTVDRIRDDGGFRHQGVNFLIHLLFQELQKERSKRRQGGYRPTAKLEWAYLGLLNGHPASPITLHGKLRDDPDFFVDVLGLIFRPKTEAVNGQGGLGRRQTAAQNAYRLLRSWQAIPGRRDGENVDEQTLSDWVQKARSSAKARGLLEICDSRIGEVFAYAPGESDGSWPCIPVRDALEEIDTEEVFDGFGVGIYNKRGMVSRSMREGGAQERVLADEYRKYADASKVEWPKTAATLRRMALGYEEDARREDAQASAD